QCTTIRLPTTIRHESPMPHTHQPYNPHLHHTTRHTPIAVAAIFPVRLLEGARGPEAPAPGPVEAARPPGVHRGVMRVAIRRMRGSTGRPGMGRRALDLCRCLHYRVDHHGPPRGLVDPAAPASDVCHPPPLVRARVPVRPGEIRGEVGQQPRESAEPDDG